MPYYQEDDPRYKRCVPPSFYEAEQQKFQSMGLILPENLEVGEKNGKKYYVDHKAKTTTWVDPRTEKTRNKNINEVGDFELPYGWDEDMEVFPGFGVYYSNHILQQTFADPPWNSQVREQVSLLMNFLEEQIRQQQQEIDELEKKEQDRIDAARRRVEELEREKLRLEQELLALRKKALEEQEDSSDSESISSLSSAISDIESELDDQYAMTLPRDQEEFQRRLEELKAMNERLKNENEPGYNGVAAYKETEQELENVSALLDEEARNRERLEKEIMDLKKLMVAEEDGEEESGEEPEEEEETYAPKPVLNRKTRYEMELEVLLLKKRIQAEKEEQERLIRLKDRLERTKLNAQRTGLLPNWIRQIDQVAESSKTLRYKIQKQQGQNPDALSFRERILFFTSGQVESKNNPPRPGARRN